MPTVREYIYEPNTNNRADSTTEFEDSEAAAVFFEPIVARYDSSPQWTFKSEIDAVRTYTSNVDNNICELSNI